MTYDSRPETYEHITRVRELVLNCATELIRRAHVHDASKLVSPEVEVFDRVTPRLKELEYGSQEYKDSLAEMGDALKHHYHHNPHHPEHWPNGIPDMDLCDLIEMVCDWKAASERMKAPRASLESGEMKIRQPIDFEYGVTVTNAARFGYSLNLAQIFLNTIDRTLTRLAK